MRHQSEGLASRVNMAGSVEEANVGGKKRKKWHVCFVYCAVFRTPSFLGSFSGLPSPHPETVQLLAFSILSAIEKLSLGLVQRSNIPRMTARFTKNCHFITINNAGDKPSCFTCCCCRCCCCLVVDFCLFT